MSRASGIEKFTFLWPHPSMSDFNGGVASLYQRIAPEDVGNEDLTAFAAIVKLTGSRQFHTSSSPR